MSITHNLTGADISPCGTYRYLLQRDMNLLTTGQGPVLFVMLNPSTADAKQDDPTIRRCKRFAKDWGHEWLTVANLYALRATSPQFLWQAEDPVGPLNDIYLRTALNKYGRVVCAWGNNARHDRVLAFTEIAARVGAELMCLGTTKQGAPKHPLYVAADQRPVPWAGGLKP